MGNFMKTRVSSKKSDYKDILTHVLKTILPLIILYIIFNYKPLIIIMFFEFFDLIKLLILRKNLSQFPIDFVFVFGIAAAYYYGFLISIIIFVLGIINRMQVDHIKDRHVTKCIRHFTLFFLAFLLNEYSFFTLAVFLQLLNYFIKYGVSIIKSDSAIFDKSIFHIFNFVSSIILFYLIELFFDYFPKLV
jgi:hypothetical protein